MEVTFMNLGVDYMIRRIMEFQSEGESAFWSEPLYHFYPQLDKGYAAGLSFPERRNYIEQTLKTVYIELEDTINCVKSSYDFDSEDFKVSLLKHEAQHARDLAAHKEIDVIQATAKLLYESSNTQIEI